MALPTASDNPFPSILITEGTEPSAPAAGKQRLYIDSTSHHLSATNSSGTERDLETSGAPAESAVTFTDITTNNSSTSKHGYLKKLDNSAAHFMDGQGNWTTPAGTGSAGTTLLLDYALSADVTNQALTAGTAFDMFANQNFTVASATSLIEVIVRGVGFCNDNTDNSVLTRINIDSAGTPVIKYFPGTYNASGNGTVNSRNNPLIGGTVYISGLSAAVHTIKAQVLAVAQNDHLYCRAATAPPTGAEFLYVQVIEHKN